MSHPKHVASSGAVGAGLGASMDLKPSSTSSKWVIWHATQLEIGPSKRSVRRRTANDVSGANLETNSLQAQLGLSS